MVRVGMRVRVRLNASTSRKLAVCDQHAGHTVVHGTTILWHPVHAVWYMDPILRSPPLCSSEPAHVPSNSLMTQAEGGGFLSGRKLYATPNSIPKPDALKLIIEAAGGEMLSKSPSASSGEVIVLATEDDDRQWQALARHANVVVLHKIHFLNCGLRQKLDLVKGRLTL